jgi:hypothetical protein
MATDVDLEDAHVLFMDVVGYSKLLINDQTVLLPIFKKRRRKGFGFSGKDCEG